MIKKEFNIKAICKKITKKSFLYKYIEQEIMKKVDANLTKYDQVIEQEITKIDANLTKYDQVVEHVFRGLTQAERSNSTNFERLHMRHGVLRSTSNLSLEDKFDANQFFQYRDKAEVALCPASIWGGGIIWNLVQLMLIRFVIF